MLKTIYSKIISAMAAACLIGGVGVILFMSNGYKDLSDKSSQKSLQMLSESIFQTLRVSMNMGDPKIVEDTLARAKSIHGIDGLHIHKSKDVIEAFGLPDQFTKDEPASGVAVAV